MDHVQASYAWLVQNSQATYVKTLAIGHIKDLHFIPLTKATTLKCNSDPGSLKKSAPLKKAPPKTADGSSLLQKESRQSSMLRFIDPKQGNETKSVTPHSDHSSSLVTCSEAPTMLSPSSDTAAMSGCGQSHVQVTCSESYSTDNNHVSDGILTSSPVAYKFPKACRNFDQFRAWQKSRE